MTVTGFLLFLFGFISMVLYLFAGGVRLSFLSFIDNFGSTTGFVIRLLMIFGGMILFYVSRTEEE